MDDFRYQQKRFCIGGPRGNKFRYGCPCCRIIGDPVRFRRATRKWAKGRLRGTTSQFLRNWESQY
jgi:hypothetical protein